MLKNIGQQFLFEDNRLSLYQNLNFINYLKKYDILLKYFKPFRLIINEIFEDFLIIAL